MAVAKARLQVLPAPGTHQVTQTLEHMKVAVPPSRTLHAGHSDESLDSGNILMMEQMGSAKGWFGWFGEGKDIRGVSAV